MDFNININLIKQKFHKSEIISNNLVKHKE